MLTIRSNDELERAFAGPLDPALRRLLAERRDQLTEDTGLDLAQLVRMIVVQRGDALAAVEAAAGMTLDADAYEWVARRGRWVEAVAVLSDDGFGVALYVPDCILTDPALLLPLLARA